MAATVLPWDVKLCNACGIPIHVHVLLLVYLVVELAHAEAGQVPSAGHLPDYRKVGFIALSCLLGFLALFGTVLVHELGHCAGAKAVGGKVHKILLWPLGGLAFCGSGGGGPLADLVVTLAGPLTHLPMFFVWKALRAQAQHASPDLGAFGPLLVATCATAMRLQIILAAFNLLVPVYPLDCSKVLESLCRLVGLSASAAAAVICTLSLACIVVLACSMLGYMHLPAAMTFHYSVMNLLVLAWLALQTARLAGSIYEERIRHHPLFASSAAEEEGAQGLRRSRDA